MKPSLIVLLCVTALVVLFARKGTDTLQTWIGGTTYEVAPEEEFDDFAALLESIDIDENDADADVSGSSKAELIACLTSKNVSLYVGQSCNFSCTDVQKYGNDMKNFPCVDCDKDATVCTDLGIDALPMWYGQGTKARDIKSLEDLATKFNCK